MDAICRRIASALSPLREAGRRFGRWIDARGRLPLVILLAAAGALLLAHAIATPYERSGPDGLTYECLGLRALAATNPLGCGNFEHVYWSPGWVLTIAGIYRIFGPHYIAVRIFLIAIALATALLVHRIAGRMAGARAGLAAAALFLFSTLVFRFTAYLQYELPLGFIVLASCALLFPRPLRVLPPGSSPVPPPNANTQSLVCAGVLIGFASLISPRVLVVSVIAAAYYARFAPRSYGLKALALFAAGVLLVLTPWTIRNYRCYGELIFTTTNGGINLYLANNLNATGDYYLPPRSAMPDYPYYESRKWYAEAFRYMRAHPLQTAGRSVMKALRYWNPHYGDQGILLAAFIGGLVRIKRRRMGLRSPDLLWVLGLPIVFTAVHMIFFVQPRYFVPILPSVAIIGGIGIGGIARLSAPLGE
jgi:4-amino-4-deoxy-L-arabinose transferase-like glycosyltransferase